MRLGYKNYIVYKPKVNKLFLISIDWDAKSTEQGTRQICVMTRWCLIRSGNCLPFAST